MASSVFSIGTSYFSWLMDGFDAAEVGALGKYDVLVVGDSGIYLGGGCADQKGGWTKARGLML